MAERHVGPGQTYSTINAAFTAAGAGDDIIIHPGTYVERVDAVINTKNGITFRSSDGRDTVSWTGTGSLGNAHALLVRVTGGGSGQRIAYIRDLTLRGGTNGGAAIDVGLSLSNWYASAVAENCWFQETVNEHVCYVHSKYSTFDRCIFEGTKGSSGSVRHLYVTDSPNHFNNCLIYGGEKIQAKSGNYFVGCTFMHSRAQNLIHDDGFGGGRATYRGCVFYNWGRYSAGAQGLWTGSPQPTFDDCVAYRPSGVSTSDPEVLEQDPLLAGGLTVDPGYTTQVLDDALLLVGSPAIDHAADFGLTEDFFETVRPLIGGFDAGFHEREAPLPRPVGPYVNRHRIRRGDLVT